MSVRSAKCPLSATELVDEFFIENRNRLIEIAAFLDRLDRADPTVAANDFRMQAFTDALTMLQSGSPTRVADIQTLMSDPTTEPLATLDRKGAIGTFDRSSARGRS
jgi:hypothetical protein